MDPKPKSAETRNKILDDHREIGVLTSKIAAAASAADKVACLERLLPLLQRHFREEEDEIDGLHAAIQRQTPHHQNALLGLKEEHRALLDRAHEMLQDAQASATDGALRERGQQLKQQLAAHETKETDLFLDSIWTDLGAGD